LPEDSPSPLRPFDLFSLFWDDTVFEQLAANTNLYAKSKREEKKDPGLKAVRRWKETTPGELRIFIGLIIKMGLHKESRLALYWSKRGRNGWRKISKRPLQRYRIRSAKYPYRIQRSCMSLNRFEQLKRYFHVADPRVQLDLKHWHQKLEPLASILRQRFRQYYLPGTKVAIDEMVVRFCGRSRHTLKIRNKPIKEGYKIFALCDHGYTYGFLWYSSTQGIAELSPTLSDHLSPTSRGVLQLAQLLPSHYRWNLLLDNYFTNVPLFEKLLELGVGAAGTTRVDCAGFPTTLKIEKEEAKKVLPWGHVSGEVVGNICCLVWQDNSSVLFMTSYHDITKKVERLRRRPKKTSTNAAVVRNIFNNESRKILPIPEFIDDYNYHMGSVNIADQLRSYYSTQQRCRRNWLPLFYWLLDTSLVNAYRIQRTINSHSGSPRKLQSEHFHFRSEVVDQLIHTGIHLNETATSPPGRLSSPPSLRLVPREPKATYIPRTRGSCPTPSKDSGPTPATFPPPGPTPVTFPPPEAYTLEQRPTRTLCLLCRWHRTQDPSGTAKVKSVYWGCRECNQALCRSCFSLFHNLH